jgi:hypothetical protein
VLFRIECKEIRFWGVRSKRNSERSRPDRSRYADDLKTVGVLSAGMESNRCANRVFSDVLV